MRPNVNGSHPHHDEFLMRCNCGESSFINISKWSDDEDADDAEYCLEILSQPVTLRMAIGWWWKQKTTYEQSIIVTREDLKKLRDWIVDNVK